MFISIQFEDHVFCRGLENKTCKDLHSMTNGIDRKTQEERQDIYGSNIIEIQVKPTMHLIIYEVFTKS